MDLYWAISGRYRRCFGNLRRDDAQEVLRTALAHDGGSSDDALRFALDPLPAVPALAEKYGDPAGDGVHFSPQSVRYRWLDLAQRRRRAAQPEPSTGAAEVGRRSVKRTGKGEHRFSPSQLAYAERLIAHVEQRRSRRFGAADLARILTEMESPDEAVRAQAVRQLCPCRVSWEVYDQVRKIAHHPLSRVLCVLSVHPPSDVGQRACPGRLHP
jgi:hypothetical protein